MNNIKTILGTTLWSIVMLICIPIVLLSFREKDTTEQKDEIKVEKKLIKQDQAGDEKEEVLELKK